MAQKTTSRPFIQFFTLTIFTLLATASILPSPQSLQAHRHPKTNATRTLPPALLLPSITAPLSAGISIECFESNTPKSYPVETSDCTRVINDVMLYDPAGAMTPLTFSHNPQNWEYRVPKYWTLPGSQCVILLTSGNEEATDTFRLVDVIVKANQLIAECPWKSKKSLGGLVLVGNRKTFFVVVNGPGEYMGRAVEGMRSGGAMAEEVERNGTVLRLGEEGERWNRSVG